MNAQLQESLSATGKERCQDVGDPVKGQDTCSTIKWLLELVTKASVSVLPNNRTGYKDMVTVCARLFLGEVLCQVVKAVDADYIGCSKQMTDAGAKFIEARHKSLCSSKASSGSRGKAQNLRPNIQEFMRTGLPQMCRMAQNWRCQAAFTSFISTVLFSMLKGKNCDYVDTLQVSDCQLHLDRCQKKVPKKSGGEGKADEAIDATGGGSKSFENPSEVEEGAVEAAEGGSTPASDSVSQGKYSDMQSCNVELQGPACPNSAEDAKTDGGADESGAFRDAEEEGAQNAQGRGQNEQEKRWPGGRRLFHEWNNGELHELFTQCLTIMSEGGFWLLPHAHSEFTETRLRGSNEQGESVLMFGVFKFVSTKLSKEKDPARSTSADECNYINFYTNEKTFADVKAVFSDPKGPQCRWIEVDPKICATGFAFSATCIQTHLTKLRKEVNSADLKKFDEQIVEVKRVLMEVFNFVHRLERQETCGSGDQRGNTSSRGAAEVKQVPQSYQGKGRSGSSTGSTFEAGILDARDVRRSTLQNSGGGSQPSRGEFRSKVSDIELGVLPTSEKCSAFVRSIVEKRSGSFVLVANRVYVPYGAPMKSENCPKARLFAVFSTEESCGEIVPSVVFPCLSTVARDRVAYRLDPKAVLFNQDKPSSECWIFLNREHPGENILMSNVEEGVIWFEEGREQFLKYCARSE